MKRPAALLVISLLHLKSSGVTINIDAEALKDANGAPMTSGVIVLAADIKDFPGPSGTRVRNGFSGPTADSFSGNDFQVYRWNLASDSPEWHAPGAFQASITLSYSGGWAAGDPLRLYWFPENTAVDTGPGAGKPFGTYRADSPEPGRSGSSAWFSPAESETITLAGETVDVPKESTISLAFFTLEASALVTPGTGVNLPLAGNASSRMVVGRHLFYNGSAWDGRNTAANAADDAAIATDKTALLPGNAATFANYSSYTRGINGVMVDILNLANPGGVSASDFTFKVGNSTNIASWANGPAPGSITVRPGAGVHGSDRVTIIWPNNAIQKQWLQVTVLPVGNTGLSTPDVFYFGNAIGESGNSPRDAQVDTSDEIGARNNPRGFLNPPSISFPYDYDRDKRVDSSDEIAARNNNTSFLTALKLLTLTP